MTDSVHPTLDELADFHADLLPDLEAGAVRTHLQTCSTCAEELSRIDEVSDLLSGTGADELTMPTDVVARVDEALAVASGERTGEVASMSTARQAKQGRSPRRTPWVLIGGAAAATVFVIGSVGLGGLQGSNDADSGGDDAGAGVAADEAPQPESGAQDDRGKSENAPEAALSYAMLELTSDSLPPFARRLAGDASRSDRLQISKSCTAALSPDLAALPHAQVLWTGRPAVVVVDPSSATATVFGCGTDSQSLYSTSY